jgi:hypothetical protein
MVAKRSPAPDGLYMPVEQYLALDEATDGKYEYLNGYAFMLRPPSSAYMGSAVIDMAGGSPAHAALAARIITGLNNALEDSPCIAYTVMQRCSWRKMSMCTQMCSFPVK